MKKTETKNFYGLFADSKLVLITNLLVMIVSFLWYFVGTGYAKNDNKIDSLSTTIDIEKSNSTDNDQWQTVQMQVTAYCPCTKCCGEYSDGITACGHKISKVDRFVAADKKYPFGTEMIIPGYKNNEIVKVADRGGAVYGNHIDVFFNSHQEALQWGVKYLSVKIRRQ